jgi:hypothetical protein
MKKTEESAERTAASDQKFEGFTDEERGAMKDRAQELKAAARRGKKADEDSAVLAKITEMPEPDRAMAERLHAVINSRHAMFGFNDTANLDEGTMWPTSFALSELTADDEARIGALVKKAVS